jgi:glycosyltransferase involved in cell wall biosynthesis
MRDIFLSVIIPCYNEEENLKKGVLDSVNAFLKERKFSWEVIISDDGSTDGSKEIIKRDISNFSNFKLLENPHGGKPSALWYGIQKARGKYVLFTDMDQSTPIKELSKLIPFTKDKSVGAVIGSRGLARKNFPFYRRLGAIVFITFRKILILPEINDTQCGFKLFKREILSKAFPLLEFFKSSQKVKGWKVTSFDVELLHLVSKMSYEIEEIPVVWEDADKSVSKGRGLNRYLKESKEMLFQILRVKLNDIRGLYDFSKNV